VRSVVAGRGEFLDDLAARVRRQDLGDRVELRGFVPDEELVELFAGALAVVYAPSDEDYGYATLQAFLAGKPVVTADDAGGVLEWVEDGVTGLVTDGSPEAMGAAIDRLAADRALAERLGAAGRERVQALSWSPVVEELLGA
jgi:glycosyltransferase involved in cell wall biosynthesis